MSQITKFEHAMTIMATAKLAGPHYTIDTKDAAVALWRGLSMRERVSAQMQSHIKKMNDSAGLDRSPILAHDFVGIM